VWAESFDEAELKANFRSLVEIRKQLNEAARGAKEIMDASKIVQS